MSWFEADRHGLRKLLRQRGIAFGVVELIQNGLDEETTVIDVTLTKMENRRQRYLLEVSDNNPEGFKDLSHAYTMFAESEKKDNPEQRGRFNLGEKLVLALCERAQIYTTKGTVIFREDGERIQTRGKRPEGSLFTGEIVMTETEANEVRTKVQQIIPPQSVTINFNGVAISPREAERVFTETLPTVIANVEGQLTQTRRQTEIRVHRPRPGEKAMIYEMGLPVVETGDQFHIDVQQKVPLNMNRDNVTPAYLRELRAYVLNNTFGILAPEEVSETWVRNALEDKNVESEAVQGVMGKLFGKNRVTYDPSDPEANRTAMAEGATVIPGRSFSGRAWENIREHDRAGTPAAGRKFPTPKPFHPDGRQLKVVEPEDWSEEMRRYAEYAKALAKRVIDRKISIVIANDFGWQFGGAFGPDGQLIVNLSKMGYKWFDHTCSFEQNRFLIHEFGHKDGADHLDADYHRLLCRLGAKLTELAIEEPEFFERFRTTTTASC